MVKTDTGVVLPDSFHNALVIDRYICKVCRAIALVSYLRIDFFKKLCIFSNIDIKTICIILYYVTFYTDINSVYADLYFRTACDVLIICLFVNVN